MIVAISWVSFWLQADQTAPRIMLGTTTMLTFITLASAQGKTLPKVSYIKASEIWFMGCTGFIFGSLVEFAFVNTIWRRKKNVELKKVKIYDLSTWLWIIKIWGFFRLTRQTSWSILWLQGRWEKTWTEVQTPCINRIPVQASKNTKKTNHPWTIANSSSTTIWRFM